MEFFKKTELRKFQARYFWTELGSKNTESRSAIQRYGIPYTYRLRRKNPLEN